MKIKSTFPVKLIILSIIFGIVFYIFPTPSTFADCPDDTANIRLLNESFLSLTDDGDSDNFQFKDPLNKCVIGEAEAKIAFTSSYESFKAQYMSKPDQTIVKAEAIATDIELDSNIDKTYVIDGNLTIGSSRDVSSGVSKVVFVSGNLTINANLTDHPDSGVVFVVGGNASILNSVTIVNAFIITFGEFCSNLGTTSGSCRAAGDTSAAEPQLVINGSVISMNSSEPKFTRNNSVATVASERVLYQAKYLVLARDTFSRSTTSWSEIK